MGHIFAVKHGYPEKYFVHVEHPGRSSLEEAQAVLPEIRRERLQRVLIGTSNYHTRCAGRIFRSLAPDLVIRVIPAPEEFFTPDGWWRSRQGHKIFLADGKRPLPIGLESKTGAQRRD
ncbi:MAG: hypothetical protein M3O20_12900 [Acidobacteriota bacterium]|nr:hypothetical protein [Acidobacteriota bacterium]